MKKNDIVKGKSNIMPDYINIIDEWLENNFGRKYWEEIFNKRANIIDCNFDRLKILYEEMIIKGLISK